MSETTQIPTYLDSSGSMRDFDFSPWVGAGRIAHYFGSNVAVKDGFPMGGTRFGPVFAHALGECYNKIRIVTDGCGEFDAAKPKQRPTFPTLESNKWSHSIPT